MWERLENAILNILKNQLVEKLVIKFLGKSSGFTFWIASIVGKHIVTKWGEPVVEDILRSMEAETIKVDAKIKIVKSEDAKDRNDKDDYFKHLGSI